MITLASVNNHMNPVSGAIVVDFVDSIGVVYHPNLPWL
jgi:hypothetical protein